MSDDNPKPKDGESINDGLDNLKVAREFIDAVIDEVGDLVRNTEAFLGYDSHMALRLRFVHRDLRIAHAHTKKAEYQISSGAHRDAMSATWNMFRGVLAGSVMNGTPEERAAVAPMVLGKDSP